MIKTKNGSRMGMFPNTSIVTSTLIASRNFHAFWSVYVMYVHLYPHNFETLYNNSINSTAVYLNFQINELPKPKYLQQKLSDLRIGTLNDIETATEETSIIEALKKFVNRRVSALPLIDTDGRLKDIYAKFDVIVSID